jgi:hypothetical protein
LRFSRFASFRDAFDPAGRGPSATCIFSSLKAAAPSKRFTLAAPVPGSESLPLLVNGSVPETTSTMKMTASTSCTDSTAKSGRMPPRLGCASCHRSTRTG